MRKVNRLVVIIGLAALSLSGCQLVEQSKGVTAKAEIVTVSSKAKRAEQQYNKMLKIAKQNRKVTQQELFSLKTVPYNTFECLSKPTDDQVKTAAADANVVIKGVVMATKSIPTSKSDPKAAHSEVTVYVDKVLRGDKSVVGKQLVILETGGKLAMVEGTYNSTGINDNVVSKPGDEIVGYINENAKEEAKLTQLKTVAKYTFAIEHYLKFTKDSATDQYVSPVDQTVSNQRNTVVAQLLKNPS